MNKEFFEALAMLEKEKGIPMQYLIEKIEAAISIAIKRDENGAEDNVVEINPDTGRFYVAVRKTVVDEIEDPATEILKAEAAKYNKIAAVGRHHRDPAGDQGLRTHCCSGSQACDPPGHPGGRA